MSNFAGEIAALFIRIRPNLGNFKAEVLGGVKPALNEMQAAVAATAAANIAATQREILVNRELAASYIAIGGAAKVGSAEAIIASKLAADATARANAQMATTRAAATGGALGGVGVAGGAKAIGGLIGLTTVLYGVAKAGRAVVVGGADFETSMNVFGAVSQATAEQMKAVDRESKLLGADITLPKVSASDAAQAMTELAKGGIAVEDAMSGARGTLQLSAAGAIDVGAAAGIVAQQLNVFGLAGDQAVHVADLLAGAANSAQGEVSDMAIALQQSAAVARQAGFGVEETVTAIALLAKNGLIGSDAGTSLRTTFLRLVPTTKEARDQVNALGIEVANQAGELLPLGEIFQNYKDVLVQLTPIQRQQALTTIFGTDSIRAASIFAREGAKGFAAMAESVNQEGAAAEFAAARTRGLGGAWGALKSNLETVAIGISQKINPAIQDMVEGVNAGVTAVVRKWPEIEAAIRPVLDDVRSIIQSFAEITRQIWSHWGTTLTEITTTVLAVVGTIVKNGFATIAEIFKTLSALLQGDWDAVWEGLKNIVSIQLDTIVGIVTGFGNVILSIFQGIWANVERHFLVGLHRVLEIMAEVPTSVGVEVRGVGVSVGFENPAIGAAAGIQDRIDALDARNLYDAAMSATRADREVERDARARAASIVPEVAQIVVSKKSLLTTAGTTLGTAVGTGIGSGLASSAGNALDSLNDQLRDAVKQGEEAVRDAVLSAQRNLVTLGQGLSAQIAQAIDAGPLGQKLRELQERITARQTTTRAVSVRDAVADARDALNAARQQIVTSGPVSERGQSLIDEFLEPKAEALRNAKLAVRDFNDQAAAGRLGSKIEQEKKDIAEQIDALTNQFVSSAKPTAERFAEQIREILAGKAVAFSEAGKTVGTAFATGFRDQVAALLGQASSLESARGSAPSLLGEGGKPEVVKPLGVMNEQLATQREIRDELRRARVEAAKSKAKAVSKAKAKAGKKNAAIVYLPGKQSKESAELAGATG